MVNMVKMFACRILFLVPGEFQVSAGLCTTSWFHFLSGSKLLKDLDSLKLTYFAHFQLYIFVLGLD